MDSKVVISNIRGILTKLRKTGQEFVSIDAFFEYLSNLESAMPDSEELRKLQHDSNLAHYRAVHETNLEMFKSVIEAGRTALTSCILVNSGATVALLAYLGNYLSKNPTAEPSQELVLGLVLFATAVLLGAVAAGVRYLSQASYFNDRHCTGTGLNIFSIVLVVGAYVLFGFGIYEAYQAFS